MKRRKPDRVFNVWGDGVVTMNAKSYVWTAREIAELNKAAPWQCLRITHRIRVFMKDKRS